MKSDGWLTRRIIDESLNKHDISLARRLIQQGKSDEEVLLQIRKRMFVNSQGMRDYVRHEKIRALMVKLTSGIHWVCLLPVIKTWITEKEELIRWRESAHAWRIDEKTRELRGKLIDSELKKMKFNCANGEGLPENVMEMIEKTAEELLADIEESQRNALRNSGERQEFVSARRSACAEKVLHEVS